MLAASGNQAVWHRGLNSLRSVQAVATPAIRDTELLEFLFGYGINGWFSNRETLSLDTARLSISLYLR